jgi:hypothetical protein
MQGLEEEVIAWAKDENEPADEKRREMKTGMEWTRERGAMRKSIVLSEQGEVCAVHYLADFKDTDPPLQF